MEFVLVYIWTMFCTSVIALYGGNDFLNGIYVYDWLKVILILPVKKGRKIPIYIIVVHGIIQFLTILCFILLAFHIDRSYVFRIYGILLFYGCILCVLILRKLYDEKYNTKYGSSPERSYCLKYHINDSKRINVIYKKQIDEYEMVILWDGEYLAYCLFKIEKMQEIQYRIISVFRMKKRMLYFEKKVFRILECLLILI